MAKPASKGGAAGKGEAASETVEWIVTARRDTGEIVKVEHVDEESGERKEFPLSEYLASFGPQAYGPAPQEAYAGYWYQPYGYDPYAQAYGPYGYDPYAC